MGSDSAPAAPLEKAVEEAKDTLAELDADPKERAFLLIRGPVALRCVHALRSLLAALDADPWRSVWQKTYHSQREAEDRLEEAEAALREIGKNYLLSPGVPGCDDIYSCKWCGGDDDHNVGCPTAIARRYFARRDKLEVPE